ncbi:glucosamine-6-phosphate deaminase [Anaerosalibacter bizertensis]|uniref:Glucosamine-6-phosphate deaminase n=1 Tax=Anaerosalibacter bizertensis TaxID=932217 RepID=A0A844FGA8_9FIRM|nr:glucosamine-6-phosphate deaminase [Anaerosalibacter bizertensis]MSS43006.1 glucosamine-6-phosphate deaminase [Anaerosalibacter bizertensis]
MKIIIEKNYSDLSKKAADIIEKEIKNKPNLILGLATGSTPVGTYKELIRRHKEEGLDFAKVTTFNLDEYLGIPHDHINSYHYFMYDNLFKHINIDEDNINIPNGNPENVEEYCKSYDEDIEKQGGIDLQILGIGENGHIAFNEPDDKLYLGTHITDLTESTIRANARFFDSIEEVPKKAITMGLGSIMKAKKILLLANGKNKANIIGKLLKDEVVSTYNPASLLLLHPDVTIILDEESASEYLK